MDSDNPKCPRCKTDLPTYPSRPGRCRCGDCEWFWDGHVWVSVMRGKFEWERSETKGAS